MCIHVHVHVHVYASVYNTPTTLVSTTSSRAKALSCTILIVNFSLKIFVAFILTFLNGIPQFTCTCVYYVRVLYSVRLVIVMPKSSTERSRACRERKRTQTPLLKPPPKSDAQRVREYRARKRESKAIVGDDSAISQVFFLITYANFSA